MNALRVALLIETSTSWGSGIVQGVAEYANTRGGWQFFLEPRGRFEPLLLPEGWQGAGVIARVTHAALAEQVIGLGLPCVNVSWYSHGDGRFARCTTDERATARECGVYFLDRGFRQFAYCGASHRPGYIDRFGESFVATVQARGFPCSVFAPRYRIEHGDNWADAMEELGDWIESLPKPVALLAFEGVRGRQLTEACRMRGIDVPGEVAVLGGDHDELSSRISSPKLSTIDHSPERIGFKAAELLDKMISTGKVPGEPVLLPPAGVVTRQSTDTLAVDDPLVARAIHYIRENAHRPIQVRDILEQVPISRRSLELRLAQLLGHSPAEEIRRARLQVARRLLLSNDEQMPWIAAHSGFERVEVLTRAFRKAFGITPSAYRRQFRR